MMHGLLVLCGPTVFPAIGPVSVSGIALAAVDNASAASRAPLKTVILVFIVSLLPSGCLVTPRAWTPYKQDTGQETISI